MRSVNSFTQRNIITQQEGASPGPIDIGGTLVDFPKQAKAPIAAYSGIPADGLAGDPSPTRVSSSHAPCRSATPRSTRRYGQLTDEYPDCATGQLGYPIGELLLPGQPYIAPGIAVGDMPGLAGADDRILQARR